MKYSIQGFGTERLPWNQGVVIAQSEDRGYAVDIAKVMAFKYEGQIFGVQNLLTGEFVGKWHYELKEGKGLPF